MLDRPTYSLDSPMSRSVSVCWLPRRPIVRLLASLRPTRVAPGSPLAEATSSASRSGQCDLAAVSAATASRFADHSATFTPSHGFARLFTARSRSPRYTPWALSVRRPEPAKPRTLFAGLPARLPSPFLQLTGLRNRFAPRLRLPPPPLSTSWLAIAGLTIGCCLQASGLAPFVPLTVAQSLRAEPRLPSFPKTLWRLACPGLWLDRVKPAGFPVTVFPLPRFRQLTAPQRLRAASPLVE